MLQRKFDKVVKEYFPNARDAKDTSIHYLGKMQIEHKLDVSKVLMATSVCSDDINIPSTTFFNVLFDSICAVYNGRFGRITVCSRLFYYRKIHEHIINSDYKMSFTMIIYINNYKYKLFLMHQNIL